MPGRKNAVSSLRRGAAAGALALILAAQAAPAPDPAVLHRGATTAQAGSVSAPPTGPAHADVHAAGHPAAALLWRALALAVGAGVAWGLYRLGRGAAGAEPRRHDAPR